jgi:hypothetical protein
MDLLLRFEQPDANMGSGQTPPTNRSAQHVLILQEDSPCNMVGLAANEHRGHPRHAGVTTLTPVISWTYV